MQLHHSVDHLTTELAQSSLVSRPSPSFPALAVQLGGEGLVYFLTQVMSRVKR